MKTAELTLCFKVFLEPQCAIKLVALMLSVRTCRILLVNELFWVSELLCLQIFSLLTCSLLVGKLTFCECSCALGLV